MNRREQAIQVSRRLITDDQLIKFLRAVRTDDQVLAVKMINKSLDRGQSLDEIFYTGDDYGFLLSVERLRGAAFNISFGCQAGPLAGDGGDWEVVFDAAGKVGSLSGGFSWIS